MLYLIGKLVCSCLDQIYHVPFLYIGATFACFQMFGTFLCVIVALNSFSNVGARTSFSGFKNFGPVTSGPNDLFTLSNDNCSLTSLKVISIWLIGFIVHVRKGRSAGSDFPMSSIIDFSAKIMVKQIRFAFTICNNTIIMFERWAMTIC